MCAQEAKPKRRLLAVILRKAIKPLAPATGGRDRDELDHEAGRARTHAQWTRSDLTDQMVGMFRTYDATVRYGRAQIEATPLVPQQRAIRRDLRAIRKDTERAIQGAIRQAYSAQLAYGKRAAWNWRDLDVAEDKFVQRLRQEEFAFVSRFLDDIDAQRLVMPLEQRARLYGQAGDEAFWWGFLYADQSADQYLKWVRSPDESCPDCLYLAGDLSAEDLADYTNPNAIPVGGRWRNGVYSAQELARLAIVPQSGELTCTTNCKCRLERVLRPEGKPQSRMQRRPFRSLQPKYVQPRYEEKRRRVRTKRVKRGGAIQKALEQSILGAVMADLASLVGRKDSSQRRDPWPG